MLFNRSIAIHWKLDHPMPISHYRGARITCVLDA
jgi:hypothetical protein